MLGHVGDGNFHQMIMYNPNKPEEAAAVKRVIDDMMHKALDMEGTVSVRNPVILDREDSSLTGTQGEHGVGLGKKVSCPPVDVAAETDMALALPAQGTWPRDNRHYEGIQAQR